MSVAAIPNMQPMVDATRHVPGAENIASMPKDLRKDIKLDAKKVAQWTLGHLENSRGRREVLERMWTRVDSYMDGFHYFEIDTFGAWRPTPMKQGEVRGVTPVIRATQRRELGRFTENILTVQALPRSASNKLAVFKANRGEAFINHWLVESDFADVYEEWVDQQIHYGLSALYRYIDHEKKQVFCEAWPAEELHPIPWNATRDPQLQGFMRVKAMTKSWIDEFLGAQWAAKAGRSSTPGVGRTTISSSRSFNASTEDEAMVAWVWLKGTKEQPGGQHYIIVEDEIASFVGGLNEQGKSKALRGGRFPVEFGRYAKSRDNWYGMGLLPTLLGHQKESDRQWSKIIQSSRLNNGMLFVNDEMVNMSELMDDNLQIIPVDSGVYGSMDKFFDMIPPTTQSREIGASLNISQDLARQAAGHDSDILFGKAEGRVESGPLGRILNVNAQAPIAPTLSMIRRRLIDTYTAVLDMLSETWPDDKRVSIIGEFDAPSEMIVGKPEERPTSEEVVFQLSPLLPAGRAEMANLLVQLRQMPGDNKQPMITDGEFRRGLSMLGMSPPGLKLVSKKDQRIRQRVSRLFGDGKTPGKLFDGQGMDETLLRLEDPRALRDAVVERVLDPAFDEIASPEVKMAFLKLLQIVRELVNADPNASDGFDENLDQDAYDSMKMEEFLDADEQRPDTMAGHLAIDGAPIGA